MPSLPSIVPTQQQQHEFATRGRGPVEITRHVSDVVRASGVRTGLANVFTHHTSCSLLVTENADPDVLRDLEGWLRRAVVDGDPHFVHTAEGPDDMSAHVRSVLTGVSLNVPVVDGQLALGTWQGIFLWEHRTRQHRRRVTVTVLGG